MAKIIKRTWTSQGPTGRRVRRVAFGYTLMVDGQRERRISSDWPTEDDALQALAARQAAIAAGHVEPLRERTLTELAGEYCNYKTDRGKRSTLDDARILATRLLPAFGPDLPVRQLTTPAIAQYERRRMAEVSAYTVALKLAVLRHMLRLGRRWATSTRSPRSRCRGNRKAGNGTSTRRRSRACSTPAAPRGIHTSQRS
jgi:hypothetical protein